MVSRNPKTLADRRGQAKAAAREVRAILGLSGDMPKANYPGRELELAIKRRTKRAAYRYRKAVAIRRAKQELRAREKELLLLNALSSFEEEQRLIRDAEYKDRVAARLVRKKVSQLRSTELVTITCSACPNKYLKRVPKGTKPEADCFQCARKLARETEAAEAAMRVAGERRRRAEAAQYKREARELRQFEMLLSRCEGLAEEVASYEGGKMTISVIEDGLAIKFFARMANRHAQLPPTISRRWQSVRASSGVMSEDMKISNGQRLFNYTLSLKGSVCRAKADNIGLVGIETNPGPVCLAGTYGTVTVTPGCLISSESNTRYELKQGTKVCKIFVHCDTANWDDFTGAYYKLACVVQDVLPLEIFCNEDRLAFHMEGALSRVHSESIGFSIVDFDYFTDAETEYFTEIENVKNLFIPFGPDAPSWARAAWHCITKITNKAEDRCVELTSQLVSAERQIAQLTASGQELATKLEVTETALQKSESVCHVHAGIEVIGSPSSQLAYLQQAQTLINTLIHKALNVRVPTTFDYTSRLRHLVNEAIKVSQNVTNMQPELALAILYCIIYKYAPSFAHSLHSQIVGLERTRRNNKIECFDYVSTVFKRACIYCKTVHEIQVDTSPYPIVVPAVQDWGVVDFPSDKPDFYYGKSSRVKDLLKIKMAKIMGKSSSNKSIRSLLTEPQVPQIVGQSSEDVAQPQTEACVGYPIRNGTVLLGRRGPEATFSGKYGGPGGKIDDGEDQLTALKREIFEETGCQVVSATYIADTEVDNTIVHHYQCVISGEPEVKEPTKCEKWEWFNPQFTGSLPSIPGLQEVLPKLMFGKSGSVLKGKQPEVVMTSGVVPEGYITRASSLPDSHKLIRIQNKDDFCCVHALHALGAPIDKDEIVGKLAVPERGLSPLQFLDETQFSIFADGRWVVNDGSTPYSLLWTRVNDEYGHFDALATPEQFGRMSSGLKTLDMFVNGKSSVVPFIDVSEALPQIMTFSEQRLVTMEPTRKVAETILSERAELYQDIPDIQARQFNSTSEINTISNLLCRDIMPTQGHDVRVSPDAMTAAVTTQLTTDQGKVPTSTYIDLTAPQVPTHISDHRMMLSNTIVTSTNSGQWHAAVRQVSCMFPVGMANSNSVQYAANVLMTNNDRDANGYIHYYSRLISGMFATQMGIVNMTRRGNVAHDNVRGNGHFYAVNAAGTNASLNRTHTCIWPDQGQYVNWLATSPNANGVAQNNHFSDAFSENEFSRGGARYHVNNGAFGSDQNGNLNCHVIPLRTGGKMYELPAYRDGSNVGQNRNYWTILANVWREGLGLGGTDRLRLAINSAGNCLTSDFPVGRVPIVISPLTKPASLAGNAALGGAQFTEEEMLNPDSWRDAISWMLANVGYVDAFHAAFNDVLTKFRFIGDNVTQLPTMPSDRFAGGELFERTFLARIALLRIRAPVARTAQANDYNDVFIRKMWATETAGTSLTTPPAGTLPAQYNNALAVIDRLAYMNAPSGGNIGNFAPIVPAYVAGGNAIRNADALVHWYQATATINFDDLDVTLGHEESWQRFRDSDTVRRFFGGMTTTEMINARLWCSSNNMGPYTQNIPAGANNRVPFAGLPNWSINNAQQNLRKAVHDWAYVDRRSSLSMINFELQEQANYPCGLTLCRNQIEGTQLLPATSEAVQVAALLNASNLTTVVKGALTLACQMRAVVDSVAVEMGMCHNLYLMSKGEFMSGNTALDSLIARGSYTRPTFTDIDGYMKSALDKICGGWNNIGVVSSMYTRSLSQSSDSVRLLWPLWNRFYSIHENTAPWIGTNVSTVMRVVSTESASALLGVMALPGGPIADMIKTFSSTFPGQNAFMHNFAVNTSVMSICDVVNYLKVHSMIADEHMNTRIEVTLAGEAGKIVTRSNIPYQLHTGMSSTSPRRSDCCPLLLNTARDYLTSLVLFLPARVDFGTADYTTGDCALYSPARIQSRNTLWGMDINPSMMHEGTYRTSDHRNAMATSPTPYADDRWLMQGWATRENPTKGTFFYSYGSELLQANGLTAGAGVEMTYNQAMTRIASDMTETVHFWMTGSRAGDRRVNNNAYSYGCGGALPNMFGIVHNVNPNERDLYTCAATSRSLTVTRASLGITANDPNTLSEFVARQPAYHVRAARKMTRLSNTCDVLWLGPSLRTISAPPLELSDITGTHATFTSVFKGVIPGTQKSGNLFVPGMPRVESDSISWGVKTLEKANVLTVAEMLKGMKAEQEKATEEEESAAIDQALQEVAAASEKKGAEDARNVLFEQMVASRVAKDAAERQLELLMAEMRDLKAKYAARGHGGEVKEVFGEGVDA